MLCAGDVVLKDLQLKAEALNALKLPITVKAGFLGSIRLRVSASLQMLKLSCRSICFYTGAYNFRWKVLTLYLFFVTEKVKHTCRLVHSLET